MVSSRKAKLPGEVLREKDGIMVRAFALLANLPDDFEIVARERDPPQKRKGL